MKSVRKFVQVPGIVYLILILSYENGENSTKVCLGQMIIIGKANF